MTIPIIALSYNYNNYTEMEKVDDIIEHKMKT